MADGRDVSESPWTPPHQEQHACDARGDLRDGLEQTHAAGPLRITLAVDSSGTRAALRAAWPTSRLVAVLARVLSPVPAQVELHGVLDLARRRAQLAGRYLSVLHSGERMWSGRPGRLLTTLEPEPASARTSPLEVFDWLAASSDVITADTRADADDETGGAPVEGARTATPHLRQHLIVTTANPTATPAASTAASTAARPGTRVHVWLDEAGLIRRIRYPVNQDVVVVTVDGVVADPDGALWDRLPDPV